MAASVVSAQVEPSPPPQVARAVTAELRGRPVRAVPVQATAQVVLQETVARVVPVASAQREQVASMEHSRWLRRPDKTAAPVVRAVSAAQQQREPVVQAAQVVQAAPEVTAARDSVAWAKMGPRAAQPETVGLAAQADPSQQVRRVSVAQAVLRVPLAQAATAASPATAVMVVQVRTAV